MPRSPSTCSRVGLHRLDDQVERVRLRQGTLGENAPPQDTCPHVRSIFNVYRATGFFGEAEVRDRLG